MIWKYELVSQNNNDDSSHSETETGTGVITKPRVVEPRLYKVMLLNDDYTPMDFVVYVLQKYFGKTATEATKIMLDVHNKGSGVAGIFTFEIAEMKMFQVNQYAKKNRHPLKCVMEQA